MITRHAKKDSYGLYSIASVRPIPCLDNIVGPLPEPTKIKYDDVLSMVRKGFKIYKHNPKNLKEKVLVTIQNINSIQFNTSRVNAIQNKQNFLDMVTAPKTETKKSVPVQKKEEKPVQADSEPIIVSDFKK